MKTFFKRLFCWHRWCKINDFDMMVDKDVPRYQKTMITRFKGLYLWKCRKCGKTRLENNGFIPVIDINSK